MKHWSYQRIYVVTNICVTLINLVGMIVYTRTNIRLGIPDKAFVLCGSVFQSLVLTWMWIPGVVMLAHLCPKGLEASMYALLAGCHNIGSSVAQYSGAFMLKELGITPKGAIDEGHVFDNLWIAVTISACLPLITLALIPFTIPDKNQTEPILTEFLTVQPLARPGNACGWLWATRSSSSRIRTMTRWMNPTVIRRWLDKARYGDDSNRRRNRSSNNSQYDSSI